MNISRLSTAGGSGYGAAGSVERKHEVETPETRKSDAAVPAQGKRVAAYAEKVDHRIENLIASNKLSDREVNALQEAASEFQQLMQRIGNADFGVEGPKRQFLHVLGQFTHKVGAILEGAQPADPTRIETLSADAKTSAAAPAKAVAMRQPQVDTLA
jgi:hypothetical protein